MQLHEIPAGVGHVVHLKVCCGGEHAGNDAGRQREAGRVHEVQQQGDAGRVQDVGERHGHELLPTAAAPLQQHVVGVQRVEEPTEERQDFNTFGSGFSRGKQGLFYTEALQFFAPTCRPQAQHSAPAVVRC